MVELVQFLLRIIQPFAPAITPQLQVVAGILADFGYLSPRAVELEGRELAWLWQAQCWSSWETWGIPLVLENCQDLLNPTSSELSEQPPIRSSP